MRVSADLRSGSELALTKVELGVLVSLADSDRLERAGECGSIFSRLLERAIISAWASAA